MYKTNIPRLEQFSLLLPSGKDHRVAHPKTELWESGRDGALSIVRFIELPIKCGDVLFIAYVSRTPRVSLPPQSGKCLTNSLYVNIKGLLLVCLVSKRSQFYLSTTYLIAPCYLLFALLRLLPEVIRTCLQEDFRPNLHIFNCLRWGLCGYFHMHKL